MDNDKIVKLKKLLEENPQIEQELKKQMATWVKNMKNRLELERIIRRGERISRKLYE